MTSIPELRADIASVMTMIDIAMKKTREEAEKLGYDVFDLRTPDGRWVMNELIAAKVKAFNSLAILEMAEAIRDEA